MTDKQIEEKKQLLKYYIEFGAKKGELYEYYKPLPIRLIKREINAILVEDRSIPEDEAKKVHALKGSEVKRLHAVLN